MELSTLLTQPTILEQVCNNLTFEEINELQKALNYQVLNCQIRINDPDRQIKFLSRIDDQIVQIAHLILSLGSTGALIKSIENKENLKLLLDLGVNVNAIDKYEDTALIMASKNGYYEVIKILLEAGANVNAVNDSGNTSLIWASRKGYYEIVKLLLDNKADVNAANGVGNTSLIFATIINHLKIIKLLLEKEADVNAVNRGGGTALTWAISNNRPDIIKILKSYGAR